MYFEMAVEDGDGFMMAVGDEAHDLYTPTAGVPWRGVRGGV